ncbi:hypothetical protein [Streptomyces sp. CB02460]|uniref:hypothetical protein n=1 Tax=Streptomyces sp. CB02460 TaxID=1703941 RepID=UPI00093FF1AB|nr:hypothetical protein [Streptomyces sp. CB02460]OKJ73230.1 hypothetical protein AMK30_18360 [Streptomyces sp. CB02460]
MTGTDEAVADDDALYVLTAVLLTPAQFPSVLGDDYPAACEALGLEPYAEGYGLVLGQDSDGARWTVVVDDVSLVAVAIASWDCGMEYELSPDDSSVVGALPGWPLAVAVAAPGVPAPHDPEPDPEADGEERTPLSPPDTDVWGPAQRRMGADAIASQWADWRDQMDDDADDDSATDDAPRPQTAGPHPGIRLALAEARGYLEDPPPPGRIRSSFAPGDARMIRADGPGWSMVARTDDIAFLLLDEVPGEILPVRRGPELPGLLKALDAMAVRPS